MKTAHIVPSESISSNAPYKVTAKGAPTIQIPRNVPPHHPANRVLSSPLSNTDSDPTHPYMNVGENMSSELLQSITPDELPTLDKINRHRGDQTRTPKLAFNQPQKPSSLHLLHSVYTPQSPDVAQADMDSAGIWNSGLSQSVINTKTIDDAQSQMNPAAVWSNPAASSRVSNVASYEGQNFDRKGLTSVGDFHDKRSDVGGGNKKPPPPPPNPKPFVSIPDFTGNAKSKQGVESREVVAERGHGLNAKQTDPSRNRGTVSNAIKQFETAANDKQFKETQPVVNDVIHGRVQSPERTNGAFGKYNGGNERDSTSLRHYLGKQESLTKPDNSEVTRERVEASERTHGAFGKRNEENKRGQHVLGGSEVPVFRPTNIHQPSTGNYVNTKDYENVHQTSQYLPYYKPVAPPNYSNLPPPPTHMMTHPDEQSDELSMFKQKRIEEWLSYEGTTVEKDYVNMGQVDQQARPPNYMNVDNKPGPVYNPMFNTINVESSSQIDSASMYNQGAVVNPISRTFGNLPKESSSLLERPSTSHQTNQNPVTSLETAGIHSQRSVEPRSSSYNVTGQSRPSAEFSTTSKRHPDNPRLPIADLAHPTAPIPAPRRTVHTDTTPTQYPSSTNYSNSQTFLTQDHPGNRQTPQPTPQSSRSSYLPSSNQPLHSSSSSTNLPPGASHRVTSNSQS